MPHVGTFKAGQRVTVRELRGCMEQDGIRVGDVGMTMRMVNGDIGVQFDRLGGIFVRYAPGVESLVVNCCDALEKEPECPESRDSRNPWDDFWKAAEKRRDAYFFGESRAFMLTNDGLQILRLMDYFESGERVK